MLKKFETGEQYQMRSPGDQDCKWICTVERRTAKSVWLRDDRGKVERKAITIWDEAEQCFPLSRYSMAPVLNASKLVSEAVQS